MQCVPYFSVHLLLLKFLSLFINSYLSSPTTWCLSAVGDVFLWMTGSRLMWSGILGVCTDFIFFKPNLLIRIESGARGTMSLLNLSHVVFIFLSRPALHWLCQSVNDDWMCLSTCSSHHQHVIIAWTLFLAHCLLSLPSPLCLSSPVLNQSLPPPSSPNLSLSHHFLPLFAWAQCGEQVNKSLSSSGEDNEATGDTLHSADVCRCFAWSHMEEDHATWYIYTRYLLRPKKNTWALIRCSE